MVVLANETWNITQSHNVTVDLRSRREADGEGDTQSHTVRGEQRKRREADSKGVREETHSLTVNHLKPFTNYTWEVTAVSGFGSGPTSDRRRFETHQDG